MGIHKTPNHTRQPLCQMSKFKTWQIFLNIIILTLDLTSAGLRLVKFGYLSERKKFEGLLHPIWLAPTSTLPDSLSDRWRIRTQNLGSRHRSDWNNIDDWLKLFWRKMNCLTKAGKVCLNTMTSLSMKPLLFFSQCFSYSMYFY